MVVEMGTTLLGKYEVGKLVGVGASGKVYHARNIATGQSVAIKSLSKAQGGLTAAHIITREIATMRRLRNPNVVRLHEVLATKTKIYLVMELARGGELFSKISKGRFGEDLSRRFFQQLISAVGYCHSRGVFHRDLKPENLLLDHNWDLKVTDFGLSALHDHIRPDGMLHTLCGTPAYVAPEVLANRGYDGSRVDVWSCGVILFVLNAGYLPFNDANLMVMYRKINNGQFRCPKWTSPELRFLLTRLLDINPEKRITVEEILQDPWFKKGYQERKLHSEDKADDGCDVEYLNAFDLISYSSGFDISGLIGETEVSSDRFVSGETPEKILERVEEVAREAGVAVTRKGKIGAKLEGKKGSFTVMVEIRRLTENVVMVEIHRLTENLVMVETRNKDRNVPACGHNVWENTLRPQLDSLLYRPTTFR